VHVGPGRLEAGGQIALGPALGHDDLIPELVEPGQVTAIEADRELAVVGRGQGVEGWCSGYRVLQRRGQDSQSGGAMNPEKTRM
jgi:hypothetical protein